MTRLASGDPRRTLSQNRFGPDAGLEQNGRERGRGQGRSRGDVKRPLGFGILKTWSEIEDSGNLVLWVGKEHQQLEELLGQPELEDKKYRMLLKVLDTVILAQHQKETLKVVLTVVSNSMFFNQMCLSYLMGYTQSEEWDDGERVLNSILKIMGEILEKLPESAGKCFASLSQIQSVLPKIASLSGNEILINATSEMMDNAWKVQERGKEQEASLRQQAAAVALDSPPNDFTEMSVVPMVEELKKDCKPFVRAAVTKGAYKDLNHYLDVQFRLMREDFVQPLRKGLSEFVEKGIKKQNTHISDLRMYFDVRILEMKIFHNVYHVLQFDNSNLKKILWNFSKRLIEGSLLCLSKDNFTSVLLAIVCHRDVDELKNGRLTVAFQSDLQAVFQSSPNDVYVMAETLAYFESYRPVLEGLKEMSANMPLERYIVKCEKQLKPPKYLLSGVRTYDMACIMKTKTSHRSVSVLNTSAWPAKDEVCLNESQLKAVQLALTKEVALIKGPPGTGKTYVGLKIVELLLGNKDKMTENTYLGNDPILVVCYTNHALDQFLEGILTFCPKKDVIRVGGKSQSDVIKEVNLSNVRKRTRQSLALACRIAKTEVINALDKVRYQLNDLKAKKDDMLVNILSENVLQSFMESEHLDQIEEGPDNMDMRTGKEKWMHIWLNAPTRPVHEALSNTVHTHLLALVLNWGEHINHKHMKTSIKNMKDITSAPIHVKATFYQQWLGQYRYRVMTELNEAGNPRMRNNLQRHIQSADRDIVWNDFMKNVVPENWFKDIRSFVNDRMKQDFGYPEVNVLKCWILGSWKDLSGQLDDIETLTRLASSVHSNHEDDLDDDFENKRIEDERTISDLDSDDKKALEEKQGTRGNMSALVHRASTLGIQLDDDDDKDNGDWVTVHRKKPSYSKTMYLLEKAQPLDDKEEKQLSDLWHLDLNLRYALYKLWFTRYEEKLNSEMTELVGKLKVTMAKKKEIDSEESISILRTAKVIGMTTTGAAKNRAVLQAVGCRIVVVEEAAEVLEAHIVTALNKNCNHLILIGDHQQLRPNPAVYELAKHYKLDISLFERLISNGVPHISLTEQHRMRESISMVMRHIYPDLEDHMSVKTYEHVEGVAHDMFFIEHEELESSVEDTKSKSNKYEAEYLVSLCKYFLQQGYQPSQITILATYVGQIRTLRKEMMNQSGVHGHKSVYISTVDNFQGEENDIILLSLVRSNEENSVGFLKVDNRICVALSRAKKGLFAIGNFKLLKSQSKLWTKILDSAAKENKTGDALPVVCRNHVSDQMDIKNPSDFDTFRPEGGCGLPCVFRLLCGHACTLKCHGYDVQHKEFKCRAPCTKIVCDLGHPCMIKCFQECGPCLVKVPKTMPLCGHENMLFCSLDVTKHVCSSRCPAILDCEHQCNGKCGECSMDAKHSVCKVQVEYTWPCGHTCSVPCSWSPSEVPCPSKCKAILDCGHVCVGSCSGCMGGAVHKACASQCKLKLHCGHPCLNPCGLPCGDCPLDCPMECRHSACSNRKNRRSCGKQCVPCQEPCLVGCRHQRCNRKCHEPCSHYPCSKRCTNQVRKCTHRCVGLCGELCVCAQCEPIQDVPQVNQTLTDGQKNNGDKQDMQTRDGKVGETKEGERKDEDHPTLIKLPSCSHVFKLNQLDTYLKSVASQGSGFLECPKCSKPIQKCSYFEADNKDRAKKREHLKRSLAQEAKLKLGQEDRLEFCLSLEEISRNQWKSLANLNVTRLNTSHEIKSASLIVRFAFVVNQIQSIEEGFLDKTLTLDHVGMKDWAKQLKSLGLFLTAQQVREVKLELKRILMSMTLNAISGLCSVNAVELPAEMSTVMADTQKSLQRPPLGDTLSGQATSLMKSLLEIMKKAEKVSIRQKCQLIQEVFNRSQQVLEEEDEKMLADILNIKQPKMSAPKTTLRTKLKMKQPATRSTFSGAMKDKTKQVVTLRNQGRSQGGHFEKPLDLLAMRDDRLDLESDEDSDIS